MKKDEVIKIVREGHGLKNFDSKNLHFANITPYKEKHGWWVNISWPKFNSEFAIVLCNDESREYAILILPEKCIPSPKETFRVKGPRADLFISNPDSTYPSFDLPLKDLQSNSKEYDFTKHLFGTFPYPLKYELPLLPEEVPESVIEGAKKTISVNRYERSSKGRNACISHHGPTCVVCDFNFEKLYGELGKDFIHVHHLKPISEIGNEYVLDPINDLCPVCPNCHAMLHRGEQVLSTVELKKILHENC